MKKTIAILLTILILFTLFQGALRENVVRADTKLGVEYVIVVATSSLKDTVQDFVEFKESQGFDVIVEDVPTIEQNYQGVDKVEKIRNFLKDKTKGYTKTFTLLIGAPYGNVGEEGCPMRIVDWGISNGIYPTDYYYADLDGNWDSNGDGVYDPVKDDIKAEVHNFVGRVPFSSADVVKKILDNTIAMQKSELKNKALLAMINNETNGSNIGDGANIGEKVRLNILEPAGFSVTTLYEKEGDFPSNYPCTAPLNEENFDKYFCDNDIVVTLGHSGRAREIWNDTNKNGKPEKGEVDEPIFASFNFLTSTQCKTKIWFDFGCATWDWVANGYELTTAENILYYGVSPIVIGSTALTSSPYEMITYFKTIINAHLPIGEILYNKIYPRGIGNDLLKYNILGDPSFCLFPDSLAISSDNIPPTIQISSPKDDDTVNDSKVTVSGIFSDEGSGIKSIEVDSRPATITNNSFTATVDLQEGKNTITITATDKAYNVNSKLITVYYKKSKSPSSPTNLSAFSSNSSITLNWSPSQQGEYPISGYTIYKGASSQTESFSLIATVDATTTTYTDSNVALGTTYYYYMKAFDNQSPPNYSNPSNVVSAVVSPHIWSMFLYNSQHTGQSPYDTTKNYGGLKWKFQSNLGINDTPVVSSDGTIYLTSDALYALNPDGTVKWKYSESFFIRYSSPAVGLDGTVYVGYVGLNDNYLYAINPDGTLKWKFKTEDWILSSPAIGVDGTIYVGSNDGYLYAINSDGTLRWKFQANSYDRSSPAISGDGTIYYEGISDSYLYALNPDGTVKWKFQVATFATPSVAPDGTIYIGSLNSKLYALNPDGTIKWQFKTGNAIDSTPAIGLDGTIYVGSGDHNLYALNPGGTLKWKFETDAWIDASPVISKEGTVYMGSLDSHLYAVNPDGSLKWKFATNSWIWSSPAISSDGTIYVGSYDHYLYAIGGSPITITASANTGGTITPSGTITVNYGDSKTFTITPNSGYKIKDVLVDGGSVGSVSSYTFQNITSSHTIEATFEKEITQTVIILQIGNSTFTVNGVQNTLDSPPVIKNSRTLLPIRAVVEALGGTVSWDATERKVTITLKNTTIELWIGNNTASVNGVDTPIDSTNPKVVPEIINSRTMLPLRFITENLGCNVQWDGTSKTITITYPEN